MLVGRQLGPTDPEVVLATARVGARVPDALHLTTWSAYLAWPVAALAGTLVVLWGRAADLPADDASRFGAG
ncbi:MAG: hypothetical protein HOQ45_10490, partial [Nocardioidaceae bacterium]|nr:hypothetical protein [Nocardioidaceae bacterium]